MNKFACGLKIEGKYANISMLIICIIVLFEEDYWNGV